MMDMHMKMYGFLLKSDLTSRENEVDVLWLSLLLRNDLLPCQDTSYSVTGCVKEHSR